jgi:hypothetical protein
MLKTLRTNLSYTGSSRSRLRPSDDTLRVADALQSRILEVLGRALCIRAIDAGSCNGCELEIHALNNPLTILRVWVFELWQVRATQTCYW